MGRIKGSGLELSISSCHHPRMAHPLRLEYPGAVYHLTARGNARQAIYVDDEDRRIFLQLLGAAVERYQWRCRAYCLMPNHHEGETGGGNRVRSFFLH